MSETATITVPLIPPSANHYKKLRVWKGRVTTFVTKEAKAFKAALALCASGASVRSETYAVKIHIFQGKSGRGDLDNFSKVVLDGLQAAGVIHSDAAIDELYMLRSRDRSNPRTEITIIAR